MDARRHIGLAVLTRDYPGRFLAVTQAYCDAYGISDPPAEVVGRSLAHYWPSIIEEGSAYHRSWTQRHAAALRGEPVAGVDRAPGESQAARATFFTALDVWDDQPVLIISVVSSAQTVAD